MKFLNIILNKRLAMMLVLPAFLLFSTTGCGDDDTGMTDPPVEDGTYISGSATGGTGLSNDFTMVAGRVEGDGFSSNLRAGMAEGFGYLVAGELFVTIKAGTVETVYGAEAGSQGVKNLTGTNSQIVAVVDTGRIMIGGLGVNIASAGFYHVIMDMTSGAYHLYKIRDMEFTNGFQNIPQTSANADGASWRATDVAAEGNFKFRWNEGWKIISMDGPTEDDDYIIFCNFGKDGSNIIAGGGEWALSDLPGGSGLYTVEVDWTPGEGWQVTMTRTDDLPAADLSGESLGLIGEGAIDNGVPLTWLDDVQGQFPTVSGTVYSWTFNNIAFDGVGGFKFRSTGTWEGTFNIGCDFANYLGADAGDVECEGDAGSNLRGTAGGVGTEHTLVVMIDGNDVAGSKTLTITRE